jgi:putative copper resistance protein D
LEGPIEPTLRFLHYAALLGLFGCTAFRWIWLRGLDWLPNKRSISWLIAAAVAAPFLSLALMLVSIAAMMGLPVTALDWTMIQAMIQGTDIGRAFLVRLGLLVIAVLALLARSRSRLALPVAAAAFGGALMTLGWTGHAAATEGVIGLLHRVNNGVHLLAAGLWLGAIGWFLHLSVVAHRRPDHVAPRNLLTATHRFAPLGVGLVATVALTGLINSQLIVGLENGVDVIATSYGVLLAAKVALVGGMLAFGAHNARIGRQHALGDVGEITDPGPTLANLRRSLIGEFGLAIGVIALVAVLGMMSPMLM